VVFFPFFFFVFDGQFCDVTKVTIIPKKQKKEPNLPTLPNMKVEKEKKKGVLPYSWLPNRTYHKSLVF
jgi:hypothetical protein